MDLLEGIMKGAETLYFPSKICDNINIKVMIIGFLTTRVRTANSAI